MLQEQVVVFIYKSHSLITHEISMWNTHCVSRQYDYAILSKLPLSIEIICLSDSYHLMLTQQ